MLVLTRRTGEETVFTLKQAMPAGTTFRLVQLGVKGNQVRFGVTAPKEIAVDRSEVYARKEAEKRGEGPNGNR